MKRILKRSLVFLISLKVTASLVTSLSFTQGLRTFIIVALFLTLFDYAIKPILGFLLIPINLLTLGLFRGLIDTFGLYLASLIIPNFIVNAFSFSGSSSQGFSVPAISFSLFWTYVLTSFLIGVFVTILNWALK